MATLRLLELSPSSESPGVLRTVDLPVGPTTIGRDLLDIHDKRLSRSQLRVEVLPSGEIAVTRLGANDSFVEAPGAPLGVLAKGKAHVLAQGAIVWLTRDPAAAAYRHPISITPTRAEDAPSAQPSALAASSIRNEGSADGQDTPPAAGTSAEPARRGVWEVLLAGSFQPYESEEVQSALEAALHRGEPRLEVEVRGQAYVVEFGPPARQLLKSDATRTRPVRRRACDPPLTASAPHASLDAAVPPAAACAAACVASGSCDHHGATAGAARGGAAAASCSNPPTATEVRSEEGGAGGADDAPPTRPRHKRPRTAGAAAAVSSVSSASEGRVGEGRHEEGRHEGRSGGGRSGGGTSGAGSGGAAAGREGAADAAGEEVAVERELEAEVRALRARGEAISPHIFDGEADVDAELRFLLRETSAEDCAAALPRYEEALRAAAGTREEARLRFCAAIVAERAAGGAAPLGGGGAVAQPRVGEEERAGERVRVEMCVLDVKESGEAVDVYGVRADGAAVLLRVRGFRSFFYVRLASAAPDGEALLGRVREALWTHGAAGGKGDGREGWGEAAVDLRLERRIPLLACFEEATHTPRAPPRGGGVWWLRVAHTHARKPKELLDAMRRAPSLRADLATDEEGELLSCEDDLSPAGSSKLMRRFAVEKDVAGGAWLEADAAPLGGAASSRCAVELACDHSEVRGHAPLLLGGGGGGEEWSRLPPLSRLSVRVLTAAGETAPQWEAREHADNQATEERVEMICAELWRRGSRRTVVFAHAAGEASRRLEARRAGEPLELRCHADEAGVLRAFEAFVVAEADPDVIVTYDARAVGLVADRHAALHGCAKGAKAAAAKAKAQGSRRGAPPLNLGREIQGATTVQSVETYSKAWVRTGGRQQSENLETHEVVGCTGRYSLDVLRAVVTHQAYKLTSYSFGQAVEAVLGEPTERIEPCVLAKAGVERKARHLAQQVWQLSRMCSKLKTLEETVEMARLTGLPLRTISNQAQMVRTENLMLKAARTLGYVLPLSHRKAALPAAVCYPSSELPLDVRAFQHWPWPWAELEKDQQRAIQWGVAGHCSHTALKQDGSTGLHDAPVVVLDFASLYPSVFIAHNICYSTLLPPDAHNSLGLPHHRTFGTTAPNTRVRGSDAADIAGELDGMRVRRWPGDAIAFVREEISEGLFPRLLRALLAERRAVKRRIKEVGSSDGHLASVLEARQLTLKLLANASYGFCGADTSRLRCKPLAEACLRIGNHYCKLASRLIEEQGAACAANATPLWPQAAVVYANTDSVFVRLPGRTAAEAAQIGRAMAEYVSSHAELPAALNLEYERVLFPFFLDGHNRYAGAEYVSGTEAKPVLYQKGLLERAQAPFIQRSILGMLEKLLVERDEAAALEFAAKESRALLSGEIPSDDLVEGGFIKRANQADLVRMAGLSNAKKEKDDETLRKQNCYALAIAEIQRTAVDGRATRVFRLGEWVPFILVHKSGGATGSKQFENVAAPDDVILFGIPVNLHLIYTNRLLPALFGQVRDASGAATKYSAEPDKPVLLGRLLSQDARRGFKTGEHSRKAYSGVLTCDEGWRLYGRTCAPHEKFGDKATQGKISNFFFKKTASSSEGPPTTPPSSRGPTHSRSSPNDGEAQNEIQRWEEQVLALKQKREAIALASGHEDGQSLLLCNLASPLANSMRLLDAARAKLKGT